MRRIFMLTLLVPALTVLTAPLWIIASLLVSDAALREAVAREPLATFKIAIGLAVFLSILGWPLAVRIRNALRVRRVTIDGVRVRAQEPGLLGVRGWSEPLNAYTGLAHRVRSSLSGVRQELVLVHPRAARSVLLATSPRGFSQETIAAAARLLSVAEIPSREGARLSSMHGFFHFSEPQPELAAGRVPGLAGL